MTSQLISKPLTKPLKGSSIFGNVGNFSSINASSLSIDFLTVPGLIEDGGFNGVIIKDSELINTVIGLQGANVGYFTELHTSDAVTFLSHTFDSVSWDPDTGQFYITSELKVGGCSLLGNIEICNNDIQSSNLNGDINIKANGLGNVYLNSPVNIKTSNGNLYNELSKGFVKYILDTNFNIFTSHGNFSIDSFQDQTLTTKNGDISFTVDSGRTLGSVLSTLFTQGNIVITTNTPHYLTNGNIINLSSSSLSSNFYTVGQIISDTKFSLTSTTTNTGLSTGGNFIKNLTNSIYLNTDYLVKIPSNTLLTFGDTTNSISSNTGGMYINSSNIYFTGSNIYIPGTTILKFSTSSIQETSNKLHFSSSNIQFNSNNLKLNSSDVSIVDPILKLADYTLSSNDSKDRGIEYRYYDSSSGSMKLGWFGVKNSTDTFTFIPDATNTNEIITGSYGNFQLNTLTINSIQLSAGSSINMNCGDLLNLKNVYGCNNDLNFIGSSNINFSASSINLVASSDISLPSNIPLKFGTVGSLFSSSGSLYISSFYTKLSTSSLIIPQNSFISLDGTTTGNYKILYSSGSIYINSSSGSNSSSSIYLTSNYINIPDNTKLFLGTQSNIYNSSGTLFFESSSYNVTTSSFKVNTSSLNLSSLNDILLLTTNGNVSISENKLLNFNGLSNTNNSIVSSNGNLIVNGSTTSSFIFNNYSSVNLGSTNFVNFKSNSLLNFGSNGNIKNSSSSLEIQSFSNLTLITTSGNLNISTNNTYISSSNIYLNSNSLRFNSSDVSIVDPILKLADYTLVSNDSKDRGIEYRYYDSSSGSMKLGWFGVKNSTDTFTFIPDATNTNEIITGSYGNFQLNTLTINSIQLSSGSSINMNCGDLINLKNVYGCNNDLNFIGSSNINFSASNTLNIISPTSNISSSSILIPTNSTLNLGPSTFISNSAGILTISSNTIILNSDVQINGTTSNIFSTVTNLKDPIFSLGGVTGTIVNDLKDRGIEFKWTDSLTQNVGFFGFKQNNNGRFVYIKNGTNTSEVFSGSYGDVEFNDGYYSNIYLNNNNSGGNIYHASNIYDLVSISNTTGSLYFSSSNIYIPQNSQLNIGDSFITSNTSGISISSNNTFIYSSSANILSSTTNLSSANINIPQNSLLNIGTSLLTNSTSGINISSSNVLFSSPITLPYNNNINFVNSNNSISSDGFQLIINGYQGIYMHSSTTSFSGDVNIIGSLSASNVDFELDKYILPLGTTQALHITSITNVLSNTNGNISITTSENHNFTNGDSITIVNSNSSPLINNTYIVSFISTGNIFYISSGSTLVSSGDSGTVKSNIMTPQNKDVGIQINYYNNLFTSGSAGYKNAFFGFINTSKRFVYYSEATISNDVVSGTIGNIEINKLFTNNISGFTLDGNLSAGSNQVSGTNFAINGGNINNTPIGGNTAQTGRFTSLSNTVSATLENVTFSSKVIYTLDKYTLNSATLPNRSPSTSICISSFSVSGTNYTTSSGTMGSTSIAEGTMKMLVCSSMGTGCMHTIYFGSGKLITPNPMVTDPVKLVFKRQSQSAQLVFNGTAWILLSSGCYVE